MKKQSVSTWELLRPHARPYLSLLAVVVGLGIVTSSAQALSLGLFIGVWGVIFPDAEMGSDATDFTSRAMVRLQEWAQTAAWFDDWRLTMLTALSAVALVLAVVAGLTQYGYTRVSRRVSFKMIVDLRVRIARHLMGLSMQYHGQRKFGDVLSRVSSDVTLTLSAVETVFRALLLDALKALMVFLYMMSIAPLVTIGVLVVMPIALWPVAKLTRKVRKSSKRSQTSLGTSVQALTQMFQGIRTVKSFGGEELELSRYRELNESYLATSMRMVRSIAFTHAWTAFYSIAGIGVLVFTIGWLQISFELFAGGGVMGAWFLTVARLNNHVKNATRAMTKYGESAGASERIQELLDERVEVVEAAHPQPLRAFEESIRFEDVSYRYPTGEGQALSNVDLVVRPGETLALVGPSGAGKSTLVDLLARFADPTSGRITVDGHDLRDVSIADWTSLIAAVGQVPFLFHSSIGENIAYGKVGASQAEIEDAARAADIHDFIAALPDGYETDVADMGTRLSGGQRQRITIARALLKGAPILLLDEATSALDSESEKEVQAALDRLMKDRTVIVIAHRLSTIKNAHRIAVLEGGRLVELGTHDELVVTGGTYARLSKLQNMGEPLSQDAKIVVEEAL